MKYEEAEFERLYAELVASHTGFKTHLEKVNDNVGMIDMWPNGHHLVIEHSDHRGISLSVDPVWDDAGETFETYESLLKALELWLATNT